MKKAQAEASTIEAVTALVSPQAGNIECVGFAVLGLVIKAIDDAGTAAGANGLSVTLDAQLIADIKSIAAAVKGAVPVAAAKQITQQTFGEPAPHFSAPLFGNVAAEGIDLVKERGDCRADSPLSIVDFDDIYEDPGIVFLPADTQRGLQHPRDFFDRLRLQLRVQKNLAA